MTAVFFALDLVLESVLLAQLVPIWTHLQRLARLVELDRLQMMVLQNALIVLMRIVMLVMGLVLVNAQFAQQTPI